MENSVAARATPMLVDPTGSRYPFLAGELSASRCCRGVLSRLPGISTHGMRATDERAGRQREVVGYGRYDDGRQPRAGRGC